MAPPRNAPHYLKEVWTPMGGWYCDPVYWRRNTFFGLCAGFAITGTMFFYSVKMEERPNYPRRWIPSLLWCKNFPDPPPGTKF
eukprot:g1021.t1